MMTVCADTTRRAGSVDHSDTSSESEHLEPEMPSTELKEKAMTLKLSISIGKRVPNDSVGG